MSEQHLKRSKVGPNFKTMKSEKKVDWKGVAALALSISRSAPSACWMDACLICNRSLFVTPNYCQLRNNRQGPNEKTTPRERSLHRRMPCPHFY